MSYSAVVSIPLKFVDGCGVSQDILFEWDLHSAKDHDTDIDTVAKKMQTIYALSDDQTDAIAAIIASNLHTYALNYIRMQGKELHPYAGVLPGPHLPFPPGTVGAPFQSPPMPVLKPTIPLRPTVGFGLYGPPKTITYPGTDRPIAPLVATLPGKTQIMKGRKSLGKKGDEKDADNDAVETEEKKKPPKATKTPKEKTPKQKQKAKEEEEESEGFVLEGDDGNFDSCELCDAGGDLLCCDRCPRSFHPKCVGLEEVPDGDWYCPKCVEALGPNGEYENSDAGPKVNKIYGGPFNAPKASSMSLRHELASIMEDLRAHDFATPFLAPVDPSNKHYYSVILRPLDLSVVYNKLVRGEYGEEGPTFDPVQPIVDLRLIFHNARLYNKKGSTFWRMAEGMSRELETALRDRVSLTPEQTDKLTTLTAENLLPLKQMKKLKLATAARAKPKPQLTTPAMLETSKKAESLAALLGAASGWQHDSLGQEDEPGPEGEGVEVMEEAEASL